MKYLKTNLEGKVRNLPHFKGEALLPVFEAVVNSIQAIEERGNLSGGEIEVRVVREAQGMLADLDESGITEFITSDNGIGFNEANYDSFETSDSIHKQALGGKGVGRFLWLKAFESVEIESVYAANEQRVKRTFGFTTKDGIQEGQHGHTKDAVRTVVRLRGFKKEYQRLPSAYKTTAKIAQRIMEHCLSYFISGEAPRITVLDQDERLVLNEVFDKDIKHNITQEIVQLEGHAFSLVHIKLYSTHEKMHNDVLCANRRDVKALSLAKSLGTSSQFDDADRRFTYALYVTSAYLDQTVDNYRLDFEIPEDAPLLSEAGVVSMKQIEGTVAGAAKVFLREFLEKARERKEAIVASYVANENPALRSVPHYCPEVFDEIEPNSTPEKLGIRGISWLSWGELGMSYEEKERARAWLSCLSALRVGDPTAARRPWLRSAAPRRRGAFGEPRLAQRWRMLAGLGHEHGWRTSEALRVTVGDWQPMGGPDGGPQAAGEAGGDRTGVAVGSGGQVPGMRTGVFDP